MLSCPSCAERLPDGARFCFACGRALSVDSVDPTRTSVPSAVRGDSSAPSEGGRFIPGAVIAGRYRIHGLLGRGGMGEVYRADDLVLGQSVALKFLPGSVERDASRRARFLNEVKIARQISHASVCRVYDVGSVDGRHFLSMEYVDGEDLAALLRRIGHLPKEKAIEIARQLCAGLAAAHGQGILHRDLKPANVMVDGRGKAKITDFGLAILAAGPGEAEDGAGTPAYMAPELLEGRAASVKSDLYALGLVLYEIFTGHRAFNASSSAELAQLQRESTPTSPGSHVDGLEPAVERAILRCLRHDPAERPASALAVAASLPGGDPLAAALAAGETPSPELVAASTSEGALSVRAAAVCAAALVVGIVAVVGLSSRTQLVPLSGLDKPPEVLREHARAILGQLGYGERPGDSTFGFTANTDYLDHVGDNDRSPDRWLRLADGRPPAVRFWYRQSAGVLLSFDRFAPAPTYFDPPTSEPGMATVFLDARGRLEQFQAVPPELDPEGGPDGEPDWSKLLNAAGLDAGGLSAVEPRWTPVSASDRRAAWEARLADTAGTSIRIEAAAYRDKPVSFRIIYPWTKPAGAEPASESLLQKTSAVMIGVVLAAILVGAGFVARRNLRLGRGDRRGASRLAAAVFLFALAAGLLDAHFVPGVGVVTQIIALTAFPLLITAAIWIFYLALEPQLRRIWPQVLVSWVRMLDGRFKDPLVARDVYIGVTLGFGLRLIDQACQLVLDRFGVAGRVSDLISGPPIDQSLVALSGLRHVLSNLSAFVVAALIFQFGFLVLLLLCRIILRKTWPAILAFIVLTTVTAFPPGPDLRAIVVWSVVSVAAWLLVFFRLGLLTLVTAGYVQITLTAMPLTWDLSAWYSQCTVLALIVIGGIAALAMRQAMASRPGL
jgi:predicted Ser/Thr protein kinase